MLYLGQQSHIASNCMRMSPQLIRRVLVSAVTHATAVWLVRELAGAHSCATCKQPTITVRKLAVTLAVDYACVTIAHRMHSGERSGTCNSDLDGVRTCRHTTLCDLQAVHQFRHVRGPDLSDFHAWCLQPPTITYPPQSRSTVGNPEHVSERCVWPKALSDGESGFEPCDPSQGKLNAHRSFACTDAGNSGRSWESFRINRASPARTSHI